MKKIIGILVLSILFVACKKPENRTCFKFIGEDSERIEMLSPFNKLVLKAHLEYTIVQDSTDHVVIKGGKNLVQLVRLVNEDGILTIKNENKCNFLRNEKKTIQVEIHCTSIANIRYEGSEPLKTIGTLKSDYFNLFILDGAGSVNLNLDCIYLDAGTSNGWGDYTLSGKTNKARIGVKSNGYCDVRNLIISDSLYVAQESVGDIHFKASNVRVFGYLKGSGNIYYSGIPSSLSILKTGSGEVIAE